MMTQLRPERYTLETRNGPLDIEAVRLATGSSHERLHTHLTDHAEKHEKCHACRWYEIGIYRLATGSYVVHTAGRSTVPNEETWYRIVRADAPIDVIEALVVSKDKVTREGQPYTDRFITRPAQDALDHAAEQDARLDRALDVWVERATLSPITF